jgi:hypothetical protein
VEAGQVGRGVKNSVGAADAGCACGCVNSAQDSGVPSARIRGRPSPPDSFASRLIYRLLNGLDLETSRAYGALAMTTPADTSMATLAQVEHIVRGGGARVVRLDRGVDENLGTERFTQRRAPTERGAANCLLERRLVQAAAASRRHSPCAA